MDSYKVFPAGDPGVDTNGTYGYAVLPDGFRQMPVFPDDSLMVGRYPGGQDFYFYPNVPERGVLYPRDTRWRFAKWAFPENAEADNINIPRAYAPYDPLSFGAVGGDVLYPDGSIRHRVGVTNARDSNKRPVVMPAIRSLFSSVFPPDVPNVYPGFSYTPSITPYSPPPKSGIDYHYKMAGYYPPRPNTEWNGQMLLDTVLGIVPDVRR